MTLILPLILLLPAPAPQETGSAPASRSTATCPAGEEEARVLFKRAVEAQTPGAGTFPVHDFRADLKIRRYRYDEDSDATQVNEGSMHWRWMRRDGVQRYYRHLVRPDGSQVWLVHNGRLGLMKNDDRRPVRLSGPDYAEDRKQLREELERTRQLVELMFLGNLRGPETGLSLGKRGVEVPLPRGGASVRTTELHVDREDEPRLTLRIGDKDHLVYEAVLHPEGPGAPVEAVRFDYHTQRLPLGTGETFEKVVLPLRVLFLRDGRRHLEAIAGSPGDIAFNVGLTRRDFVLR